MSLLFSSFYVLCRRSISSTLFPWCAPGARASSSFARTLDSGATVRSPNYDLRGSSVTCASHGGTMERLARMVQRSLDCARNGFYGLSVPQWLNTAIREYRRYGYLTVFSDRPYGHYRLALPLGDSGARLAAPSWSERMQWTSQGWKGGGRAGKRAGKGASCLFTPKPPSLIFLSFSGCDSAGARPFPCRSSCADANPVKHSSAASRWTDAPRPLLANTRTFRPKRDRKQRTQRRRQSPS